MYIDTHCHLDFPDFDADRETVIENARKGGLAGIINVGTDVDSSRFSVSIARKYDIVSAVVGIHPSEVKRADREGMRKIEKLAQDKKVVGIGETGLDFHYGRDFERQQKEFLAMHIQLAGRLNLPLVIHQRDSRDEIIDVLEKEKLPDRVVFHCFGADEQLYEYCLKKNFNVSFTGIITFRKADDVRKICLRFPADRIMAETDAPFLSPAPFRGKRNEPLRVRHVVEAIAQIKPGDGEKMRERIFSSSKSFFNL